MRSVRAQRKSSRGTSRIAAGFLIAIALALTPSNDAAAEPYLAVYKGMQCSMCHSNPSGAGKRNAFGNVFAQTELPVKRRGDPAAEMWTGEINKWLSIGGDLRGGFKYVETPDSDSTAAFDVTRGTLYIEANLIADMLSIYIDQQLAPGGSQNLEAYVKLKSPSQKFFAMAGQFYLPFGLRLQDDTAFIRQATGITPTACSPRGSRIAEARTLPASPIADAVAQRACGPRPRWPASSRSSYLSLR